MQDFTRIYSSLGLGKGAYSSPPNPYNPPNFPVFFACATCTHPCSLFLPPAETVAALQAFRKRHADAQRIRAQYAAQPTTVDFAHYRSVLKNKAIVDDAEKIMREFKPATYDVGAHVKAIEAFEAKAVSGRLGI